MFFGNKKSSVGRMTKNDANIISRHVLTTTLNICGKNDGCPPPIQTPLRQSIAFDLALYLCSLFIFRITARHFFETVKPNEITEAAEFISKQIFMSRCENYFYETKIRDNLEYYAIDTLDTLMSLSENEIQGGIIAYTDTRCDSFGIKEIEFNKFCKEINSVHSKFELQKKSLALFKCRISNHYSISPKEYEYLSISNWIERLRFDSIVEIDRTIEKLSCK